MLGKWREKIARDGTQREEGEKLADFRDRAASVKRKGSA